MKALSYLLLFVFTSTAIAQHEEKIWQKAIPATEMTASELPKFLGYKSMDSGNMIPATEDAVRGYFIRRLNMQAGNFDKKTIVKMTIRFVVGKEGTVTATPMTSEHQAYVIEGKRVATALLPKMTPATSKGKPVAVRYDFPLIFVARPTRLSTTKSKEVLPNQENDSIDSITKE